MPERAAEILRYFWLHPNTVDDLESVVRWRLLEEAIDRNIEEISEALGWLVAEGLLLEEAVGRSGSLFRLNQDELPATERFLSRAGERQKTKKRGSTGAARK